MSKVTVENLPEEVLVEVFKWLDTKSLKNVMLTCKEWADYVIRSHHWMLNLTDSRSIGGANALLASVLVANRKYSKVLVETCTDTNVKALELFEKHGESITELTIYWYHSTNASFWCKILNTMPNLMKVMIVTNWDGSISDVSFDELPRLHKLKTLQLNGKSTVVLKLFKKCQLHTVTLKTWGSYLELPDHQSGKEFWNFLATQQDLKELKLDRDSCSVLFGAPVTVKSIPYRLKKLSVYEHDSFYFTIPANNIRFLMGFMKLHKYTLEDLELHLKFPANFYEFVFSEFKCLKTLSLAVRSIPQPSVERLEVNEGVTNLQLSIFGWSIPSRGAKPFVSRLPNVQKLVMNGPRDYPICYIADSMKQLKNLDMSKVEAKTFDGARFPAMESLRIRQLDRSVNWFAVAKNNPGINELWIGDVGKLKYLDLPELTRNFKLHKLTIESSQLKCDEKFFQVIRENCPELKSLELNEESLMVDISTVADIPGLRFSKF